MVERKKQALLHNRMAGLSPAAVRLLQRADAAMASKQLDVAESALIAALAMAPRCVEAQRQLGVIQQMRGDHAQAVAILRQSLYMVHIMKMGGVPLPQCSQLKPSSPESTCFSVRCEA